MAVDVPIALLGYGNVGGAVARLLAESADDIERATGHRLRIVRALVRDPGRERKHLPVTAVPCEERKPAHAEENHRHQGVEPFAVEPFGHEEGAVGLEQNERQRQHRAVNKAERGEVDRGAVEEVLFCFLIHRVEIALNASHLQLLTSAPR